MSKLLKILGRSVHISLEWILVVFLIFIFALRTHSVQTYLGQLVTSYLSAELNSELSIGSVEISFFDQIYLKDISVKDRHRKDLLFLKELHIKMDDKALLQKELVLNSIRFHKGSINIDREPEKGIFNFQFLIDYFSKESKANKNGSPLKMNHVALSEIDFSYNDRREDSSSFGVDFNHLQLQSLGLDLNNFALDSSVVSANIANLYFKESSGFELKSLSSDLRITNQKIKLKELNLRLLASNIEVPLFELNYDNWDAFQSFEDSVAFNSELSPSIISMEDLSYFVPKLKGMTDTILLEGTVLNPINSLTIKDFGLYFGHHSQVLGDFQLPNFSERDTQYIQHIKQAHIDLKDFNNLALPDGMEPIDLGSFMAQKFIDLNNVNLIGNLKNATIDAGSCGTFYGSIQIPDPLKLQSDSGSFLMYPVDDFKKPLFVERFSIGEFLNQEILGGLNGAFHPVLRIDNTGNGIYIKLEAGRLDRFDVNGHSVSRISLDGSSIKNNILDLHVSIKDTAINLYANAKIDLKTPTFSGAIKVNHIDFDALNFTSDTSIMSGLIAFDFDGENTMDWDGEITCNNFQYLRGKDTLKTQRIDFSILSDMGVDAYAVKSEFLDAQIMGDFDWQALASNFVNDLAEIFPSIRVGEENTLTRSFPRGNHLIEFDVLTKAPDRLLNFFVPDFHIDSMAKINGKYNAFSRDLDLNVAVSEFSLGDLVINGLNGEQRMHSDSIFGDYLVDYISYKDSLKFNLIEFYTHGTKGLLESQLSWEPGTEQYSKVDWETMIYDENHLKLLLQPSFFSLDSMRWAIVNASEFSITSEDLHVERFELNRADQNIKINGCLSKNDFDSLKVKIQNVDVSEISSILGLERSLEGLLSGFCEFSNPTENFNYSGNLSLKGFHLSKESIGDIMLRTKWDNRKNAIDLKGLLKVDGLTTFNLEGGYFIRNKNLEMDLTFENTDVSFLNAFVDPDIINNISGDLDGLVKVNGIWNAPVLTGKLALDDIHAKIELLGVDYFADGEIDIQEGLFALNNIPLRDAEGNTGSLIGSVIHDEFMDWSYDVQLNFEEDLTKWRTSFPFGYEPLDQFLILDTKYKDGASYFGKAYGRGNANIYGYGDNMMLTLNVTTQENTEINFPMYGSSEIDEDFDFVHFKSDNNLNEIIEERFDFTGLDLDLNFNIDPKSKLNIIFDPSSGDQIHARGSGNINMKLNPFYEIDLNGTYVIAEGSTYDFAMGIIKQKFAIEKGSTISWTGDPYNADIDLVTSFSLPKVSIKDLAPEIVISDYENKQMKNQKVDCYLSLNETLLAPQISFDIKAPNAPETAKALLNEVISEESELSRQFFSLLLLRRFQPLNSSIEAHATAAIDLAESQVNSLLSDVSEEYDLNFSSIIDETVGLDLIEFGISRRFFNDRLILSGSFGLEDSSSTSDASVYIPVGDLYVEYLFNESGTFRASAFREADPYNVGIDESGQKPYTQGAGLSYQEDFTNIKDFKLIQYIFDIFRPKEKRKYLRKKEKKLTKIDS